MSSDGQVGVGGLPRTATAADAVPGDGDDVTEDGAGRGVTAGALAVEHQLAGGVGLDEDGVEGVAHAGRAGATAGIIAGCTRTLTRRGTPSAPASSVRSQMASSLTTQSISRAACDVGGADLGDALAVDLVARDAGVEGQRREDGGLGGGVEALDVGGRVGLGVAQGLGLLDGLGEARRRWCPSCRGRSWSCR